LEKNIHRILGELGPVPAAEDYARQLSGFAENGLNWPRFDLVLLGLGADGHTASLFPGSSHLSGVSTVAVSANYQDRPAKRVSLTPDVINSASNVVFLAVGFGKASALATTVGGARNSTKFPAQRIQPVNGNLWWLADEAASSLLPDCIDGVTILR
jgi:6-phosphogluconolactonase